MKYPIILVHGVMIKDFKFFRAFGRIERALNANGYPTYTAKIDGMGSIENNAIQLKAYILEILKATKATRVNLIAHSKGGLDSKYMLERLEMADYVASLTTLSTPYKGSPIASSILKLPGFIIWPVKTWFNVAYKIFGDKNPDSLTVCKELALKDVVEECLSIASGTYIQSYSASLKRSRDDFIMGIPRAFCKYFYKRDTDGLVDSDSSKISNYKGMAIDETISHTNIVDFMVGKRKREKIIAFYLKLAAELKEMGF